MRGHSYKLHVIQFMAQSNEMCGIPGQSHGTRSMGNNHSIHHNEIVVK